MNKRYDFWNLVDEVILSAEQKVELSPTIPASDVAAEITDEFIQTYSQEEIYSILIDYVYYLAKDTAEEVRQSGSL